MQRMYKFQLIQIFFFQNKSHFLDENSRRALMRHILYKRPILFSVPYDRSTQTMLNIRVEMTNEIRSTGKI